MIYKVKIYYISDKNRHLPNLHGIDLASTQNVDIQKLHTLL